MHNILKLFILFWFFCLVPDRATGTVTDSLFSWLIYYGEPQSYKVKTNPQLVVLEPGHWTTQELPQARERIAYLSMGEVHATRDYFSRLREKNAVIEKNPDWEDAYRIDLRSSMWQEIVLSEILPVFIQKKFQGIFLDTIDVADYLENRDPKKFLGMRAALQNLIKKIKSQYPQIKIYINNGLNVLPLLEDHIDGIFVEDLFTGYDFAQKRYVSHSPLHDEERVKLLRNFRERTRKPVFVILYTDDFRSSMAEVAKHNAEKNGFYWYLTDLGLTHVGRFKE